MGAGGAAGGRGNRSAFCSGHILQTGPFVPRGWYPLLTTNRSLPSLSFSFPVRKNAIFGICTSTSTPAPNPCKLFSLKPILLSHWLLKCCKWHCAVLLTPTQHPFSDQFPSDMHLNRLQIHCWIWPKLENNILKLCEKAACNWSLPEGGSDLFCCFSGKREGKALRRGLRAWSFSS